MFGQKKSYSPTERFDYLQKLIHEFNVSNKIDARRQVLANICSFAYNPINFEALNRLNAIPLLLETIDQNDQTLTEFAVSGLSNLCVGLSAKPMHSNANHLVNHLFIDPLNNHKIYNESTMSKINRILESNPFNDNLIISGLTLLVYGKHSMHNISDSLRTAISANVTNILKINRNPRVANLALLYL